MGEGIKKMSFRAGNARNFQLAFVTLGLIFLSFPYALGSEEGAKHLTQAHLGETAHVIGRGKLLVGLRQLGYGVTNRFSIETIPLYSLLGTWSVFGKAKLLDFDKWDVAVRGGVFYITWEQLPEVQDASFWRYYVGGIVSLRLNENLRTHFNISNTSLHGDILSKNLGIKTEDQLTNLETDIEYRRNDKHRILVGAGYNFSTENFTLGGSHLWLWTDVYLKLGMTFRTKIKQGISLLPYFDLGIVI